MKAIRVHKTGAPEVMRLEEMADPKPGPGQVLVRVKAAGVNPVDTYVRAGEHGYSPQLPYTPGADAAGLVEIAGEGVAGVGLGARVYGCRAVTGSYAEKAIFDSAYLFPLPKNVSFAQGACIGIPYTTAYWALFERAKAQPGDIVLVHGASGGVGTAGVQLAAQAMLTVIGTAGSEDGKRLAQEAGACHVLDHSDPAHFEEAMKLTDGRGIDVILEMLANQNLGKDLKILAPSGRVVVIGSRGTVEIDPRDTMVQNSSIMGMRLKNTPIEEFRKIHARIVAGLEKGDLRPVVGLELPLFLASQAHRAVMTPPACGNIVLIP